MLPYLDLLASALPGAGLFTVVGALFGGLAGALTRTQGQAPGGPLGNAVAATLNRRRSKDLSPFVTGAIVGACDGALFLGILGFILGTVMGWNSPALHQELPVLPLQAVLLLAIGALLLGALAYILIWGGVRAVGVLFFLVAGALLGAVLQVRLSLRNGFLFGLGGGSLLGMIAAFLAGPFDRAEEEAAPLPPEEARDHISD